MFTPGLAISYLAKIFRPDHVYSVKVSRVWRKCRFLEHSSGRRHRLGAGAPSLVSYITIATAG